MRIEESKTKASEAAGFAVVLTRHDTLFQLKASNSRKKGNVSADCRFLSLRRDKETLVDATESNRYIAQGSVGPRGERLFPLASLVEGSFVLFVGRQKGFESSVLGTYHVETNRGTFSFKLDGALTFEEGLKESESVSSPTLPSTTSPPRALDK